MRLTVVSIYLWKESLYSDGQQFHQYQPNEQSITSHLNSLEQTQKCGGVNGIPTSPLDNWISTSPLDNWISNGITYINKQ